MSPVPPTLSSIAPVFSTPSVAPWLAHYKALGFVVDAFDAGYGFASRDGIEIHVSRDHAHDPKKTAGCAYLAVDDADVLADEWVLVAGGRTIAPVDSDYGTREGAHIDPDGNLIRFGSRR